MFIQALFKARTAALLRRGREILEDLRQREQVCSLNLCV